VNIPDGLPTLSAGAHSPGDGKACVMEYVALLAGEAWTDTPACTYRPLARAAQVVNDRLRDEDRHLLVPLIGRLFGTTAPVSDTAFARFAAMSVLPLARAVEHLHPAAKACNDVVGRYWRGEASIDGVRAARKAAAADAAAAYAAYAAADAAAYAAASAYAAYNAAAAYAAASAADAASSYAAYAYADAAAAYAAADAAAAAAAAAAASERLVGWLSDLIDEYDRLSGRTSHREVTSDDLRVLAEAVAR
jgi:hypothetical protein